MIKGLRLKRGRPRLYGHPGKRSAHQHRMRLAVRSYHKLRRQRYARKPWDKALRLRPLRPVTYKKNGQTVFTFA